jgi:toxin ParE1/3/4
VAGFRLSVDAERDLEEIGSFSRERWGDTQAVRYLLGLDGCFRMLVDKPHYGRACDDIAPGLRRYTHGSHEIFFEIDPNGGVFILCVLHQRMLPERHFGDDE